MKLSYCILSRILPVLVTFTAVIGLISCGGGTDVGNPDVCGTVTNPGGGYAAGARVVLGTGGNDVGLVYTTYVESVEGIVICFKAVRNFDTAYCDSKGQFTFKEVPPGDYSLLASQGALLALQKINHSRDYGTMAGMQLSEPAEIAVRMVNPGSDSLKFIAARIDGTLLAAVPDSTGVFRFPPLPAGDLDIIFYRENET